MSWFLPYDSWIPNSISMIRKKLIAGNHKMHTTLPEGMQLAKELYTGLKEVATRVDVLLIPPFTHLFAVSGILKNTPLLTGAQNCAEEAVGAYTGEISAGMLASAGARYVLVGHSERRQLFGEQTDTLRKKTHQALAAGLHPIYCFGETLAEREGGDAVFKQVIQNQLETLQDLSHEEWANVILAYEPVWAIGTGHTASAEQAQEVHTFVRGWVMEAVSKEAAQHVRILYGGSVNAGNAESLLSQPDIDGALVGGASLKADSFTAIVHAAL